MSCHSVYGKMNPFCWNICLEKQKTETLGVQLYVVYTEWIHCVSVYGVSRQTNKKHKLKHTQSITVDEEGRKIICFLGMALFLNAPLLFNGTCTISGKVVRRLIWTKWNCRILSPSLKFAKSFFPIQNFTTSWIVENLEFYA